MNSPHINLFASGQKIEVHNSHDIQFLSQGGMYRGGNKGLFVLLSRTQEGPGRTVKQEQEEISRNYVQTFISPSVYDLQFNLTN